MAYLKHLEPKILDDIIRKVQQAQDLQYERDEALGRFEPQEGVRNIDGVMMVNGSVIARQIIEDMNDSPPELDAANRAAEAAIAALSTDALAEFLAVMWIGRNDGGEQEEPFDFNSLVREGRGSALDPTVHEYIAGKGPLARYLAAGRDFLEERQYGPLPQPADKIDDEDEDYSDESF